MGRLYDVPRRGDGAGGGRLIRALTAPGEVKPYVYACKHRAGGDTHVIPRI